MTPIEEKVVKIQIGNNSSHIITRIQFSIQLYLNSPLRNKKIQILDYIVKEEIHWLKTHAQYQLFHLNCIMHNW